MRRFKIAYRLERASCYKLPVDVVVVVAEEEEMKQLDDDGI